MQVIDNGVPLTEPVNYASIIEEVIVEGQKTYPDLIFAKRVGDGSTILDASQSNVRNVPEAGYIFVVRIIFNPSTTVLCYDLQVLF